jgi:hypothetical protein
MRPVLNPIPERKSYSGVHKRGCQSIQCRRDGDVVTVGVKQYRGVRSGERTVASASNPEWLPVGFDEDPRIGDQ